MLLLGCGPEEEGAEADGGEPGVRVVGQVDVIELCGVDGAKVVSFRARRVGCVPKAPCTVATDPYKEIFGDAATCPASQTALEMEVRVESPGRYQIEAQSLTDGGYVGRCFGPKGADEVAVGEEEVAAGTRVVVYAQAGPCVVP